MTYLNPVHALQCNSNHLSSNPIVPRAKRQMSAEWYGRRKAQNKIVKRLVNRSAWNWAMKRGRVVYCSCIARDEGFS